MVPAIVAGGIAAANLIGNAIQASNEAERRSKARGRLAQQQQQQDNEYMRMLSDIGQFYDRRGSLGSADDVQVYREAISGYDPEDFVYNRGKFSDTYDKTREDFLNPYMDAIIGDTAATVQHTAAGAGLGRGSGAATAIADAVAKKNDELMRTAQQDFESDRDFAYKEYDDYARAMQDALNTKRSALENKISMTGNLANDYFDVMDSRQADLLRARQDKMSADTAYANAMAGLY